MNKTAKIIKDYKNNKINEEEATNLIAGEYPKYNMRNFCRIFLLQVKCERCSPEEAARAINTEYKQREWYNIVIE